MRSRASRFASDGLQALTVNDGIARAFFSAWITWLRECQTVILETLPQVVDLNVGIVREHFPGCKHARFIANVAALLVIANMVQTFLDNLLPTVTGIDFSTIVVNEAAKQIALISDIEPFETFRKAVQYAFDNGQLKIAANIDDFLTSENVDGYYKGGDTFMIIASRVEDILTSYCKKMEPGLKLTSDLKVELLQKKILIKIEATKFSRNRKTEPRRPRLYELSCRAFDI